MNIDRRHQIIEETRKLVFYKRTNDYAIGSKACGSIIATFPFTGWHITPDAPEKRAREFFEYAATNEWR